LSASAELLVSSRYAKLCAQTFSPVSGVVAIFDRNLVEIVAPVSDENENSLAHLKEQSLLKKAENRTKTTHKS